MSDAQGQATWVARVASYLGSSQPRVAEAAKEVCKRFKKAHPGAMSQVIGHSCAYLSIKPAGFACHLLSSQHPPQLPQTWWSTQ